MRQVLEAAVFDVDGMLLNTKEFIFQAYEHSLSAHGHQVASREMIAKQVGKSIRVAYAELAPDGDFDDLFKTHDDFQSGSLHLITAYEGLHEMLDSLTVGGLRIAAFSSRFNNLIPSLEGANVLHYFKAIVQGDEVEKHKPHPEGLNLALTRLGVEPQKAAMLGDAAVDILAGKAANVARTVGITHGFGTRDEIELAAPDFMVDRLRDIPPLLLDRV